MAISRSVICAAILHNSDKKNRNKMSISATDVSIQLRHERDEDGEYGAFTSVSVDILVRGTKAGSISGVIVDRQKIPERYFLSTMDGHSGDLQYVGVSVFEPRLGRTKLKSLRDGGDNEEFDFLYISSMHVDDQYKANGSSDVGAFALRQLLHHSYIKGRATHGCWKVSSCVYILDPYEAMTREAKERVQNEDRREIRALSTTGSRHPPEREESLRAKEEKERRMDTLARLDANQFLRNGFFQDAAVARQGGNAARFLVAACGHWTQPLKSHADAAAVQFYVAPPTPRPPTGKDAEILEVTKRICRENMMSGVSSMMIGLQPLTRDGAVDMDRVSAYRTEVSRLVAEGGSLGRSNALHAACANRDPALVRCILEMDPTTLESRDISNCTPLMIAAATAAGMSNINGMPRDQPVIDLLIARGAQKGAVDLDGMTAYGTLKSMVEEYGQAMNAMMGRAVQTGPRTMPGLAELEAKLMPPGGPTAADRSGGASAESGFIDYKEEDAEYDDDCGTYCGDY